MRKFLFSIFCATVSFLLALAPSAQAQSKSDADALKDAKEAEEAAKKEAAKRAKEAEKAAKKAREQEEAARKTERLEAEQRARARDEALRRARAAAANANKTEGKVVSTKTDSKETVPGTPRNEQEARQTANLEAEKRAGAVEDARKAAELAREAALKAEQREAARKTKEAEDAAKHEAAVRSAQEKEVAARAKETAAQLRKLNEQQEAEGKAKEAELARKAKAEKEAAKKAQAEQAARVARAEADARKAAEAAEVNTKVKAREEAAQKARAEEAARSARASEEAATRELAKETARREKAQEVAARAQEREEAARVARAEAEARKAKAAEEAANREIARAAARRQEQEEAAQAKAEAASKSRQANVQANQAPSASNVAYEGETFRIVKVTKNGSASIVAPEAPISTPVVDARAAADLQAKVDAEQARQAKAAEAARLAQQEQARKADLEAARLEREAKAAEDKAAAREALRAEKEQVSSNIRIPAERQEVRALAPVGRTANATMVPAPAPAPMPMPASVSPREEYTFDERRAAADLRARRESIGERTPVYAAPTVSTTTRSRSSSPQSRYYEELWEKELAARSSKHLKQTQPLVADAADDRRAQARYYEELWRKEQEGKATKAARNVAAVNAVSRVEPNVEAIRVTEPEVTRTAPQRESVTPPTKKIEGVAVDVVTLPPSTAAAKEAALNNEKARLNASIEASRKTPESETFRHVQLDTSKADKDALKRAEDDARRARAQEEAARKSLEQAASKKAKEERDAMTRAEAEARKKASAEDAARRSAEQEAAKRDQEQRPAAVAAQVQADGGQKEGFWSRFRSSDKSTTAAPDVSALLSEEERLAQDRALDALRQKQAELDAADAQLKGGSAPAPAVSTPSFQAQPTPKPAPVFVQPAPLSQPVVSVPSKSPEEAAKEARALAASNAELESLKKKLGNISAEKEKVTSEIETAQKELSAPSTGTTKSAGKKYEVIVDNNDARLVGTWAEGKTGGFYGKDYSFKGKGTGANYAEFTPNLPAAGKYEVFEWHVAGANRAADAPYIVNYDGGSQVVSVNQQLSGGKWNSIGTFAFAAGQNGGVRVTDGIGLQGQMVMADAIRFVLAGEGGGTTQVVDNSARERAIEALRIKQDALSSEETRLKTQMQAAQKRIAALEQTAASRPTAANQALPQTLPQQTAPVPATAYSEADVQARAQEALRQREAELNAATPKPKSKKLLSVKNGVEPVPVQEPSRPLTAKEQKLSDLLRRYKADEITPRDYHQERAKILAEP